MNQLNTILLQAQSGGGFSGIIMIVLMIAIFYFFMIRPQNKKQKEIKKAREALSNGDRVVTAGGIHGKIREVSDAYFVIEIAPNVSIKVDKNSVYPAVTQQPQAKQ
ncbi:MAG: preprotein translocase subunit YajC [Muribaculaceae bacterium]|nr:preprotein translocase subunit YajC [Bacteroides sp.]MDE6804817.1 preprotein translocase subunit YajC [Muribaculaceae bacterium]MDE6842930.1 preprotein translocase subunit YajC [Muribaculaceae bacterium]